MFQNINVAKTTPFALLTIYPKIHVSPHSSFKPPVSANYVKFAEHFSIRLMENVIPQFYSECSKIRSIRQLLVRITQNPRNPH